MKTTFEQDMMVWCRSPVQSHLVKKCKFQLLHALSLTLGNYCIMVTSKTNSCELNDPGEKCTLETACWTDTSLKHLNMRRSC